MLMLIKAENNRGHQNSVTSHFSLLPPIKAN